MIFAGAVLPPYMVVALKGTPSCGSTQGLAACDRRQLLMEVTAGPMVGI